MKLPKVRHQIIRQEGKDLYLCTDARAKEIPAFEVVEGGNGGGGYLYYLHKESNHEQKIAKKNRNILRKVTCCQQVKPSERQLGQSK